MHQVIENKTQLTEILLRDRARKEKKQKQKTGACTVKTAYGIK